MPPIWGRILESKLEQWYKTGSLIVEVRPIVVGKSKLRCSVVLIVGALNLLAWDKSIILWCLWRTQPTLLHYLLTPVSRDGPNSTIQYLYRPEVPYLAYSIEYESSPKRLYNFQI